MQKDFLLDIVEEGESSKQQIASQNQTLNYKRGGLLRALIAEASVKMF